MFLQEISENIFSTTLVKIQYDCNGDFERCGKEWTLKYKDAKANFDKNGGKHICRQCGLKNNNPASRPEVRAKVKQTCMEKYGTTCALNTAENTVTRVAKMFGTEESTQAIVDKRRLTSLARYGVDHPMHSAEVQEKQRQSMQDKYGVDHPYQSEEILKRMQERNKEKYGVENVASLPEVQVKMAMTCLKKYGVEHYNQLPEMKDYLREHCREWLKESWESGGHMKGKVRPEEWNQKQSETMSAKILRGEFDPEDKRFYVTGWYTSVKCRKPRAFFRSSLELKMHYLLDTDSNVSWYENEPFAISYEKAPGVIRKYIPDFFAFRHVGKPLLLEIKPAFRMREQEVGYKIEAGTEFCEKNGFEFLYIDEKFLQTNSLSLLEFQNLSNVEFTSYHD
jgi:hypothetical protein